MSKVSLRRERKDSEVSAFFRRMLNDECKRCHSLIPSFNAVSTWALLENGKERSKKRRLAKVEVKAGECEERRRIRTSRCIQESIPSPWSFSISHTSKNSGLGEGVGENVGVRTNKDGKPKSSLFD